MLEDLGSKGVKVVRNLIRVTLVVTSKAVIWCIGDVHSTANFFSAPEEYFKIARPAQQATFPRASSRSTVPCQ